MRRSCGHGRPAGAPVPYGGEYVRSDGRTLVLSAKGNGARKAASSLRSSSAQCPLPRTRLGPDSPKLRSHSHRSLDRRALLSCKRHAVSNLDSLWAMPLGRSLFFFQNFQHAFSACRRRRLKCRPASRCAVRSAAILVDIAQWAVSPGSTYVGQQVRDHGDPHTNAHVVLC